MVKRFKNIPGKESGFRGEGFIFFDIQERGVSYKPKKSLSQDRTNTKYIMWAALGARLLMFQERAIYSLFTTYVMLFPRHLNRG